jgi:hypothetical protein
MMNKSPNHALQRASMMVHFESAKKPGDVALYLAAWRVQKHLELSKDEMKDVGSRAGTRLRQYDTTGPVCMPDMVADGPWRFAITPI